MCKRSVQYALTVALCALAGCANYSYKILSPEKLEQRITDQPSRFSTNSMTYTLQTYEGRLVMQIYNEHDYEVELVGLKSYVVDPKGATHPLRSAIIAPRAYTKLILPPLRPRFETTPMLNIGVSGSAQDRPADTTASAAAVRPLYLDMYEDADSYYWDWDGAKPIRLALTFRMPDGKLVTDNFTIDKTKS